MPNGSLSTYAGCGSGGSARLFTCAMVGADGGRRVTVGTTVLCVRYRNAAPRTLGLRSGHGAWGPPALLLGRAAELGAIAAAVESACSGAGSALLVEGAAGIGKTRLLGYACDRAAKAGMTVLAARAAEFEDGYAWGVVRQLFEAGSALAPGRGWRATR